MQKDNRRIGAISLAIIYLLAINLIGQQAVSADYISTQQSDQDYYYSSVSSSFFKHTAEPDERFNLLKNHSFDFKAGKHTLSDTSVFIKNLLGTKFLHYRNFFLNLLINYKTTTLLYPFHHFW